MIGILHIYVEGTIDELFVTRIIVPLIKIETRVVLLKDRVQYKRKTKQKLQSAIKSKENGYLDLIILIDSDANNFGKWDSQSKKEKIKQFAKEIGLRQNLIQEYIAFVVTEIESWYLAGLSIEKRKKLKFGKTTPNTEKISKENFKELYESADDIDIDLYLEIIDNFDISEAKVNNWSFKKFLDLLKQKNLCNPC